MLSRQEPRAPVWEAMKERRCFPLKAEYFMRRNFIFCESVVDSAVLLLVWFFTFFFRLGFVLLSGGLFFALGDVPRCKERQIERV